MPHCRIYNPMMELKAAVPIVSSMQEMGAFSVYGDSIEYDSELQVSMYIYNSGVSMPPRPSSLLQASIAVHPARYNSGP